MRTIAARAGEVLRVGAIALRVLWPPARAAPADAGADPNQRAIVAEADAGGVRTLLTADAESDVLAGLDLGPVDVLKVSHHGSADPGLPALLQRLRPRLAAIEVGRHNVYGHPAAATVRALLAAGAAVVRTDRDGSVSVEPAAGRVCASTLMPRRQIAVPAFKPAYLVHGDDHGRIGERRARLRAMAEAESGSGGFEVFEGDDATPEAIALALSAMTFAIGRRFLIVDGVERWKDAEVEATLAPALAAMPPDTTVSFFGRDDGRVKTPAKLAAAVKKAGGDVAVEATLKPKELPRWAVGEAERLGITLEGAAAKALIAMTGERQQRLLRELEKLALEHGAGRAHRRRGGRGRRRAVGRAPGVGPRRRARGAATGSGATRAFLELRAQGETLPRLVPLMARRVRDVLAIATRLEAGESPAQVKDSLQGAARGPPIAASRRRGRPTPRRCAARSRRSPSSRSPAAGRASWATTPRRCGRSRRSRRSATAA